MYKAKTNKLILILCVLLSAVFAFTIGFTFATPALTINRSTDVTSTTAYLGNNDYTVVNDTLISPINFGSNGHATDVSLQYSIDYSFNVRIQYSLTWIDNSTSSASSNTNFDNVVLNFVDRDNWFVDDSYLYYAGAISSGTGKLGIIGGVDFTNPEDEDYYGLSLQINIDDVKIQASSSDESLTVSNSKASDLFSAYTARQASSGVPNTAFVAVYNSLYDYNHGIRHPNADTAYKKVFSSNTYQSSSWLGGNRYYAGAGIHIVTGSTAIELQVSLVGQWRQSQTETPADATPINNINYNYTTDWTYDSANGTFEYRHYSYVIPAKSSVYLDIADNVEITSMAYTSGVNYVGCKMITDVIKVNGTNFSGSKITTGTISTVSTSATTNYSKADVAVVNSSRYESILFDSTSGNATQYFYTNLALVNNTKLDKSVTWSPSCVFTISNGSVATTKSNSTSNFTSSNDYYVETTNTVSSASTITSLGSTTILVPAQSLVQIVATFSVSTSALNTQISGLSYVASGSKYDAWLSLACSTSNIQTSTSTSGVLTVETKIVENGANDNIYIYVKNNSNRVATLSGLTFNLYETTISISQVSSASAPSTWAYSYWNYYQDSTATTPCYYSGSTEVQMFTAPAYQAGYYLKQVSTGAYSMTGITMSYPTTLKPYSIGQITFTISGAEANYLTIAHKDTYKVSAYATATMADSITAYLTNNGTSQAKLVNNSKKQYLVRFDGTITAQDNMYTANGYNYYLGVLEPNQIIGFDMSDEYSNIDFVEITQYSESQISGWDSTFKSRLTNLFKAQN